VEIFFIMKIRIALPLFLIFVVSAGSFAQSKWDKSIAKAYGVPLRLGMAKRVTFIIGSDGKIARVFPEVRVTGHSDEVLLALGELTRSAKGTATPR